MKATWTRQERSIELIVIAVVFVIIACIVRFRLDPPNVPVNADGGSFSAEHSKSVLARILGDETPHPVDTDSLAQLRQRIIETLKESGYKAEIQEATSCSLGQVHTCAVVRNIIAIRGKITPRMIMLSAHYDSVDAGPGASDDGSGVAILLDVARQLKQNPLGQNGVLFLFTDGEEAGLLGAHAFLKHPLAKHIAVVINAEARGTSGQSTLFETGNASAWLVDVFAGAARHPLANSLINTIYKLLPNNTDLTVFKAFGMQGLNFAFGEHQSLYHTNKDDLKSLDARSLQQQGDNIYNITQSLQASRIPEKSGSTGTVYTDVVGLGLLHWPATVGSALAILLLLMFIVIGRRTFRINASCKASVLKGLLMLPLSAIAGGLTAYLLTTLMGLIRGKGLPWHDNVVANRILVWSAVLLVVLFLQHLLGRKSERLGAWVGVVYGWLILSAIAALCLPGSSYLFLLPSFIAVATAGIFVCVPAMRYRPTALLLLPSLPAFVLFLQAIYLLEIMVGFNAVGTVAMGVLLALASTLVAPFLQPKNQLRYGAILLLLMMSGSAAASVLAPTYDVKQSHVVNLIYLQRGSDEAYLMATGSSPPKEVLHAMGPDAPVIRDFPELNDQFFSTPLPSVHMAGAGLTIMSKKVVDGSQQVVVRMDADDQTQRIRLLIPAALALLSIQTEDQVMNYSSNVSRFGKFDAFVCRGEGCNGRVLTLNFGSVASPSIFVEKFAPLPKSANVAFASRNAVAVQRQDGDQSVMISQVTL